MLKHLLSLILAGLLVRQIVPAPDGPTIVVAASDGTAACPGYGTRSGLVQTRYERRLQDLL